MDQKDKDIVADVRNIVFQALELKHRGVAYACGALLADESLFDESHFSQINQALNSFSLPEDIEVYQAFGGFYKERFEEQAKQVIDSLAALDYAPLNRSLRSSGWEVPVPETSGEQFRTPDWQRLWEIGKDPVWTLHTEKGIIRVRMNTLVAPATVSAIDSLTMAGAYDGIPFHRVVPNFVIQGGDIESQDGFGGPDYILPTEASELEYRRGAVGIASAGTDTEGSQYFIMHQWKPHLNGGYTLFGHVIEGMDVVDRIIPGDTVQQVYWE
ncbi:peptidylprolyl isomerase [Balneolaceae bacterium YR4-1]|uniref:Peptidyl-prolyl cis-trans isomerase n=2 Tax=Halalkalibaculum roseum TaxID=2709311 RepID=A0A6M1SLM8_9BACT|nr:peptidylprolyl isomerase [Halalkalibaculum roseum]